MGIHFIQKELFKGALVWQLEHIGGDEELVVHAGKGVFYHFLAFASAEQDANRRIVAFMHLVLLKVRNVSVELAQILMTELVVLQFHDDAAMEDTVIEHEVGIVVFIIDDDTFLTGLETEAFTKFQEEILKVSDEGVFQIAFRDDILGFEA